MLNHLRIISYILICHVFTTAIGYADLEHSEHIKDLSLIQSYFKNRFPEVPFEDFANGVYALDKTARENWEALEEFPPYEMHIETGEEYWQANSASYKSCFPNGPAIKHLYPMWDSRLNTVVTVPYAINTCRQSHKLPDLDYMGAEMNTLVAYIAYESRDKIINISVPNEQALKAYQHGKKFYFTRRGQLNFACFHCHFDNAGKRLRTESLGPALGQTTGWPTYRNKWGALGPLHRRYIGCNNQVRAVAFEAQSETYRNLEYFHTHMNNGLPINGPAVRR
jgi:L-cysteine S-thiosulfotransferase